MNWELKELFQADRDDRRGASNFTLRHLKSVEAGDDCRKERAAGIVARGELETAEDLYHAAMILQHGASPRIIFLPTSLPPSAFSRVGKKTNG